jgi:hypothetical protein
LTVPFPVIVRRIDALAACSPPIHTRPSGRQLTPNASSLFAWHAEVEARAADRRRRRAYLCVKGNELFTTYVPSPRGPVFMTLIEKTFGKDVTTRTWDTIKKVAG